MKLITNVYATEVNNKLRLRYPIDLIMGLDLALVVLLFVSFSPGIDRLTSSLVEIFNFDPEAKLNSELGKLERVSV